MTPTRTILIGDVREKLKEIPDESVHCCITSPPYWSLRVYGNDPREIGQEKTPEEYVQTMVQVFGEVRRILRPDGTVWLNIGDSYCSTAPGTNGAPLNQQGILAAVRDKTAKSRERVRPEIPEGMKPKDLVGIPWMTAFALRSAGWWLRQDIIWAKPNCMPESVEDRCTRSHEYVFHLSKSADYFFDYKAIEVKASEAYANDGRWKTGSNDLNLKIGYEESKAQNPKRVHRVFDKQRGHSRRHDGFNDRWDTMTKEEQMLTARRRDVWWISPATFKDAHFAVMPAELAKLCVLAGTSEKGCCAKCGAPLERVVESETTSQSGSGKAGNKPGGKNGEGLPVGGNVNLWQGPVIASKTVGWKKSCKCDTTEIVPCTVLDPFSGSGTTGEVAGELGRNFVGVELYEKFLPMIERRTAQPGLML